MKNKILMAAMALPIALASCNQDDMILENMPVNKGGDIKVALNVTKEGDVSVDSRANWNGSGLTWEATDMISMYWLGKTCPTVNTALNGKSNAIFKTTTGSDFTSESLIYLGSNAVVYPANVAHYQDETITIEVPASQNDATVKNVPYISNELRIQAEKIAANTPGYHQPVFAPMKMAANVVTLKLNVKNTAALEKYGFDITSVELHAANAFTKKSNLILNTDVVETKGEFKNENDNAINTIHHSAWTTPITEQKTDVLVSEAITDNEDGTYDVRFVVLPTDVAVANATIVVNTTCGTITLETKKEATDANGNGKLDIVEGGVVNENLASDKDGYMVTISDAVKYFVSSITMPTEDAYSLSQFQGEKVGRILPRTIEVDASKAELSGSKVYTSDDIIRYVNLYTDMNKAAQNVTMDLVLSVKDVEEPTAWNDLTKAAVDAVNAKNSYATTPQKIMVTLSADETVNTIVLTTAGAVYDVPSYAGKELPLILGAGSWAMDDTFKANDKFNKIQNNGTLTINGTKKDNVQNVLVETIENNGTLNIGGTQTLLVNANYTSTNNSVLNITTGQTLTFAEDIIVRGLINGKINVAKGAEFSTALGKKVVTSATIENYGTVAARGELNGFYNAGVINMRDALATAYIQDNENGVIKLLTREDDVTVYTSGKQGKIVYDYNYAVDGGSLRIKADDRFNYLVFGDDATKITLRDGDNYSNISFEFNGATTFETLIPTVTASSTKVIKDLIIAEGAFVKVGVDRQLKVEDVVLNGTLSVGGTIYYSGIYVKTVEPMTSGTGAILPLGAPVVNFENAGNNYYINNVAGMIEFAESVNAGTNYSGKTVYLNADIDLAGVEWTPIGNVQTKAFRGTFDGQGNTISNLTVSGANGVGLFGYIDWNETVGLSEIKNVNISNAVVSGNHYVGALAGWAQTVKIHDCAVEFSSINCINPVGGEDGDKAGSVVGYFSTATQGIGELAMLTNIEASDCVVSAGRDAGQIVGAADDAQTLNLTVVNVTVKNNGTATGANIKNAPIGRDLK